MDRVVHIGQQDIEICRRWERGLSDPINDLVDGYGLVLLIKSLLGNGNLPVILH